MTFRITALSLAVVATLAAGCSAKMAYQSMQEAAHQQCLRQPDSEQARCEAQIVKDDYETYNKKRGSE